MTDFIKTIDGVWLNLDRVDQVRPDLSNGEEESRRGTAFCGDERLPVYLHYFEHRDIEVVPNTTDIVEAIEAVLWESGKFKVYVYRVIGWQETGDGASSPVLAGVDNGFLAMLEEGFIEGYRGGEATVHANYMRDSDGRLYDLDTGVRRETYETDDLKRILQARMRAGLSAKQESAA